MIANHVLVNILRGPRGRNLNWVMAHELGHALGLPHSEHESLMASHYQGFFDTVPKLFPTDISAIQSLYGSFELRLLNIRSSNYESTLLTNFFF
ncbi:unnamed protein product [Thelazia callipaeda]|uniref:Peptidase_M10 domain-containing protein n=1 Tax=Thelazia callipaeda TaxID=103827 RepID=A0A0N5CTB9_THECL|nr:unnamed protein product [Thelazia callipaeda]